MKDKPSWQKLNTAFLLMLLLLAAGVLLVYWTQETRATAAGRIHLVATAKARLQLQITSASDALRGLLLDPRNETERTRLQEFSSQLVKDEELQRNFPDYPALATAAKDLRDFAVGPLSAFQTRVLEMIDSEPTAATTYYAKNFPTIQQQREQLLTEISRQVSAVKDRESKRAEFAATCGIGGTVLLLLVSVLIGRAHAAAVTRPLRRLADSLEQLRQGDFSRRLSWDRKDEFVTLAEGLNRLSEDLAGVVGQVQKAGAQLSASAADIAISAKTNQTTVEDIASSTAEIGAASKQISTTATQLVKTMSEVSQVSQQTAALAGSGQASIASMESMMRQIIDASGSVTAKLAVLSEKTANINSVVTTITKVADQTNLLSLNAAIEAEKAGEYGLGFAVVAMEIRRLADQTAVATCDIEKLVKEMQSAVAAGVMGMEKFSEEVRRGTDDMTQVSRRLTDIIDQVQKLSPRFQMVNETMQAQAAGAQHIAQTLAQLTLAAEQTARSLQASNATIDQLNGATRSLHSTVARFKLASP